MRSLKEVVRHFGEFVCAKVRVFKAKLLTLAILLYVTLFVLLHLLTTLFLILKVSCIFCCPQLCISCSSVCFPSVLLLGCISLFASFYSI